MPIYAYKCKQCDQYFEQLQITTSEKKEPVLCPRCGSRDTDRQISSAAFHNKGTGWAKDNYASKKK